MNRRYRLERVAWLDDLDFSIERTDAVMRRDPGDLLPPSSLPIPVNPRRAVPCSNPRVRPDSSHEVDGFVACRI
jgi:hypothetical protein